MPFTCLLPFLFPPCPSPPLSAALRRSSPLEARSPPRTLPRRRVTAPIPMQSALAAWPGPAAMPHVGRARVRHLRSVHCSTPHCILHFCSAWPTQSRMVHAVLTAPTPTYDCTSQERQQTSCLNTVDGRQNNHRTINGNQPFPGKITTRQLRKRIWPKCEKRLGSGFTGPVSRARSEGLLLEHLFEARRITSAYIFGVAEDAARACITQARAAGMHECLNGRCKAHASCLQESQMGSFEKMLP